MKSKHINYNMIVKFTDILINSLLHNFVDEMNRRILIASNDVYNEIYTETQRKFLKDNKEYFQTMTYGIKFFIDNSTYTAIPGKEKRYMGFHCNTKFITRIHDDHPCYSYIRDTFEINKAFDTNLRLVSYRLLSIFSEKYIKHDNLVKGWLNSTSRIVKEIPESRDIFERIDVEKNSRSRHKISFENAYSIIKKLESSGLYRNMLSIFGIHDSIYDIEMFLSCESSNYDNINRLIFNEIRTKNQKLIKVGGNGTKVESGEGKTEKDWDLRE